jgi:hypothetical protein
LFTGWKDGHEFHGEPFIIQGTQIYLQNIFTYEVNLVQTTMWS